MKESLTEQLIVGLNKKEEYALPGQRVEGPALQACISSEDGEGHLMRITLKGLVESRR